MKRKICNICKRKYKIEESMCPMCFSTEDTKSLHEWIERYGLNEYFSSTTNCTITLTEEEIIVLKRRSHARPWDTMLFTLFHCLNYGFVFREPYGNIKRIYNIERNHKRFIIPLKVTVIEMYDGKEHSFLRFKDEKAQLLMRYIENKQSS